MRRFLENLILFTGLSSVLFYLLPLVEASNGTPLRDPNSKEAIAEAAQTNEGFSLYNKYVVNPLDQAHKNCQTLSLDVSLKLHSRRAVIADPGALQEVGAAIAAFRECLPPLRRLIQVFSVGSRAALVSNQKLVSSPLGIKEALRQYKSPYAQDERLLNGASWEGSISDQLDTKIYQYFDFVRQLELYQFDFNRKELGQEYILEIPRAALRTDIMTHSLSWVNATLGISKEYLDPATQKFSWSAWLETQNNMESKNFFLLLHQGYAERRFQLEVPFQSPARPIAYFLDKDLVALKQMAAVYSRQPLPVYRLRYLSVYREQENYKRTGDIGTLPGLFRALIKGMLAETKAQALVAFDNISPLYENRSLFNQRVEQKLFSKLDQKCVQQLEDEIERLLVDSPRGSATTSAGGSDFMQRFEGFFQKAQDERLRVNREWGTVLKWLSHMPFPYSLWTEDRILAEWMDTIQSLENVRATGEFTSLYGSPAQKINPLLSEAMIKVIRGALGSRIQSSFNKTIFYNACEKNSHAQELAINDHLAKIADIETIIHSDQADLTVNKLDILNFAKVVKEKAYLVVADKPAEVVDVAVQTAGNILMSVPGVSWAYTKINGVADTFNIFYTREAMAQGLGKAKLLFQWSVDQSIDANGTRDIYFASKRALFKMLASLAKSAEANLSVTALEPTTKKMDVAADYPSYDLKHETYVIENSERRGLQNKIHEINVAATSDTVFQDPTGFLNLNLELVESMKKIAIDFEKRKLTSAQAFSGPSPSFAGAEPEELAKIPASHVMARTIAAYELLIKMGQSAGMFSSQKAFPNIVNLHWSKELTEAYLEASGVTDALPNEVRMIRSAATSLGPAFLTEALNKNAQNPSGFNRAVQKTILAEIDHSVNDLSEIASNHDVVALTGMFPYFERELKKISPRLYQNEFLPEKEKLSESVADRVSEVYHTPMEQLGVFNDVIMIYGIVQPLLKGRGFIVNQFGKILNPALQSLGPYFSYLIYSMTHSVWKAGTGLWSDISLSRMMHDAVAPVEQYGDTETQKNVQSMDLDEVALSQRVAQTISQFVSAQWLNIAFTVHMHWGEYGHSTHEYFRALSSAKIFRRNQIVLSEDAVYNALVGADRELGIRQIDEQFDASLESQKEKIREMGSRIYDHPTRGNFMIPASRVETTLKDLELRVNRDRRIVLETIRNERAKFEKAKQVYHANFLALGFNEAEMHFSDRAIISKYNEAVAKLAEAGRASPLALEKLRADRDALMTEYYAVVGPYNMGDALIAAKNRRAYNLSYAFLKNILGTSRGLAKGTREAASPDAHGQLVSVATLKVQNRRLRNFEAFNKKLELKFVHLLNDLRVSHLTQEASSEQFTSLRQSFRLGSLPFKIEDIQRKYVLDTDYKVLGIKTDADLEKIDAARDTKVQGLRKEAIDLADELERVLHDESFLLAKKKDAWAKANARMGELKHKLREVEDAWSAISYQKRETEKKDEN